MTNKRKIQKVIKQFLPKIKSQKFSYALIAFLLLVVVFLFGVLLGKTTPSNNDVKVSNSQTTTQQATGQPDLTKLQNEVLKKSYVFKIKWGDLGKKLIADGVIDKTKLTQAVAGGDKLPQELDKYLTDSQNQIELTQTNAQFWVDVLWGLGLANKSQVLEAGPMIEGGNQVNYASTGGWTIGVKTPMQIYANYDYIPLNSKQMQKVEEIASNIYRPCCDNPTSFPDCNHGMAALGLIELMVSQKFSDEQIYNTVLAFNTYWFPQTYLNTAYYFQQNGMDWAKVSAKEILSKAFSSASGSQVISQKVGNIQWPALQQSGGSCGA